MAYGRLDIHWPDGPVDSYHLHKPTVAIGRSTGNDIVLDTSSVSRYHVTLQLRDAEIFVEDLDSVNGTYVDGKKLAANDPLRLLGGEEIQIGDIRAIFHPIDDLPTQPLSGEERTRRIEYEAPTYRVEMHGPDRPVAPGVHVQAFLMIENVGDEEDNYFIEIDGVPKAWVRIERVEVKLPPGEKSRIALSFKPARLPESAPGDYPFTVRVRSKSRPTQTMDASVPLRVLPYRGFGIDLERRRAAGSDPLAIHLHNQGSGAMQLHLSGADRARALRFRFAQPDLTLAPGQRQTTTVTISPKSPPLFGAERSYPFEILARSKDHSAFLAPIWGQYTAQPLLAGWRAWAALGAVIAAVGALVALLLLLLVPAPPPQINSLAASAEWVLQNEQITFLWDVENASSLRVEINGEPSDALIAPDATSFTMTAIRTGEMELALIAESGSEAVRESVTFAVYAPLAINTFTALPEVLVRFVTQEITLAWDVPGATSVRLEGLQYAGEWDPAAEFSGTGSQTLAVNVVEPLEVRLVAEGAGDQYQAQTLTLPVEDPACAVQREGVAVRAGPSELHRVITEVYLGQVVVPDRRDGSGLWLRVFANDDQRVWIELADLACENFNPDALPVDSAPPTAVPTDTATPTATPTPTVTPSPTATATDTPSPTAPPPPETSKPTNTVMPTIPPPGVSAPGRGEN